MASSSDPGNRPKHWGVTTPRSFAEPTEAERVSTRRLVEVLAQSYLHKTEEECHRQKGVLEKLANIVKDWVKELATDRAEEVNAKLFTFGSYFLHVDEPDSVIDTLCVGPNFVNREHDFLHILSGKLEKMSEVAGMERVPGALTPFLSFRLDEVPIKLVYASVSCFAIPEDLDICNDSVLENIDDDVTLRCLSACRVEPSILELVPNVENFRTTLRCVKHWAMARGIWSNVAGFLGVSAWSIMVARICQAHPTSLPSSLVFQFFDIFANWYWPNPVILSHIDKKQQKGWDSRKRQTDKAHCMPIIAPAYPCTNLTSEATKITLRIMKEHFKSGDEKCKEINKNNADWQDLFIPFKVFEKYMRYLHIDIIAACEEDLSTLRRWIQPKLMLFISQIEVDKDLICHPCPMEFASIDSCAFFIGLSTKTETRRMGIQIVKAVHPATLALLESWFNEWELKKPEMKLRVDQIGNLSIKSRTWGKFGLPVIVS